MSPPAQLMSLGEATQNLAGKRSRPPFRYATLPLRASLGWYPCFLFIRDETTGNISRRREWLDLLVTEVDRSRRNASEQLAQLDELMARASNWKAAWGCDFFMMRNGEFLHWVRWLSAA